MSRETPLPAPERTAKATDGLPRVLLIGSQYYPDTMEWHVLDTLREMGCPAVYFEATRFTLSSAPAALRTALQKATGLVLREPERLHERRLLQILDEFQPTLILVLLGSQLSPKTVSLLRARTTVPIVCWCQDQMTTLGRQYLLGAGYDRVFLKDRYMLDLFSRMIRSTQFHYLPEACNPRVHRSVDLHDDDRARYACDVMIAGTLYYYRLEILQQLSQFDLRIWGDAARWLVNPLRNCWMGRPVHTEEKARAVAGARISLNTLHFAEVNGLNCRAFELAGCGAFQIITDVPVLAEHFTPDEEIVCFASIDELIEKIRFYLAHPAKAELIARNGQQRAHRDHTYEQRLHGIFRITLRSILESATKPQLRDVTTMIL